MVRRDGVWPAGGRRDDIFVRTITVLALLVLSGCGAHYPPMTDRLATAMELLRQDRNVRFLTGKPDRRPAVAIWDSVVDFGMDAGDMPGASKMRDSLLRLSAPLPAASDCARSIHSSLRKTGLSGLTTDSLADVFVVVSMLHCGYVPGHCLFAAQVVQNRPGNTAKRALMADAAVFCTFSVDCEGNVRLVSSSFNHE